MSSYRKHRRKEVRLTVFDNEPTVRLAEQRLHQEGIPCFIRSLGVGPGAWGTTYNLPHGLYVYQVDEMQARDVLALPPEEIAERAPFSRDQVTTQEASTFRGRAISIFAAVLTLILFTVFFLRLMG